MLLGVDASELCAEAASSIDEAAPRVRALLQHRGKAAPCVIRLPVARCLGGSPAACHTEVWRESCWLCWR